MSGEQTIVILGAGPAALHCAESYRELGGAGRVVMIGAEPHPPYRRPPLSKQFLRGELRREELALRERAFYAEHEIELRLGTRIEGIDPEAGCVEDGSGERWHYDRCVIATGSRPALPPLEGTDDARVLTVRSLRDSARARDLALAGARALVVGSGFIGCEAAASLAARGAEVTVASLEAVPQQQRLGEQVGRRIAGWLEQAGVELRGEAELGSLEGGGGRVRVEAGGETLVVDLVVLALGIERNSELAAAAGVELAGGAVPVDEHMRTRVEGLLAAGDVALAHNVAAGRALFVEHWGEAIEHGKVAGATLAGRTSRGWDRAPGFWSTIGERTIKQIAWGDGFDRVEVSERGDGAFTARYGRDGRLVGVLTHGADSDYEEARERRLVEEGAPW